MLIESAEPAHTTGPHISGPRLRSISAGVHPASGSGKAGALDDLAVGRAEPGYALSLFNTAGRNVEQVVREAVASDPDLLLVLAGDGTARLAAELCGPDGPPLAPLPGGTLNMLPHALYGMTPWRVALEA